MELGLYKFINILGENKCRRRTILGYYSDPEYSQDHEHLTSFGACCDSCGAEDIQTIQRLAPHASRTIIQARPVHSFPRAPMGLQSHVRNALENLCRVLCMRDYEDTPYLQVIHVLSYTQIQSLSTNCRGISAPNHILMVRGLTFDRELYDKYGNNYTLWVL